MTTSENFGSETARFVVLELQNGKYGVWDNEAGKRVRYSYHTPLYGDEEWSNYYSARGFCQALAKQVTRHHPNLYPQSQDAEEA